MLNNLLISDAFAQGAEAAQGQFSFSSFVPLIAIFAIFYFLIIRPQSKKFKDHQKMVSELKSGDKVVTAGGIFGVVKQASEKDKYLEVEIAENVVVKVLRPNISEVVKDEKSKK